MWIQVRTMDGRKSARVDSLSKLTTIEQLRERSSLTPSLSDRDCSTEGNRWAMTQAPRGRGEGGNRESKRRVVL